MKFPSGVNLLVIFLRRFFNVSDDSVYLNSKRSRELLLNSKNESYWLILRCGKCDKKSIPMINKDNIYPSSRYCRHCGSNRFYLQKREDIEHLDTIYALYSKDISRLREGMVSCNNATMDRTHAEFIVSQSTKQAWENPQMDFVSNVIPFEKYHSKK